MAQAIHLPCNADDKCMVCNAKPTREQEILTCTTCAIPWHVTHLTCLPETLAFELQWQCPNCSDEIPSSDSSPLASNSSNELVAAIKTVEANDALSEKEKARRRQELLGGRSEPNEEESKRKGKDEIVDGDNVMLTVAS